MFQSLTLLLTIGIPLVNGKRQRKGHLFSDRIKSWEDLSFPSGHLENGESFYDCAVREVKEKTGLNIDNLESCGIVHWLKKTFERFMVFLCKRQTGGHPNAAALSSSGACAGSN